MKSKVESKKAVASSSSSSSSDSSDDEPKVKPSAKVAAAKASTPKSSQELTAKVEKPAKGVTKGKESAAPKSVTNTKFPKRTSTSSSDSSSSSSDDEPVVKKNKPQQSNNSKFNSTPAPKHQPVVHQSPKRDPPAPVVHSATPVKRAPGSQVPIPTQEPAPAPKTTVVSGTGDEQYRPTDTKNAVTHSFGSSCPHCGHHVEVRLKLS